MTRIVVTRRAGLDVQDLLYRLEELAGATVAEKYADDLEALYQRLEMFPASGALRRGLGRNARIAVLSPYVVIYDYVDQQNVVIVRVLDGRRNVTRRLVRE